MTIFECEDARASSITLFEDSLKRISIFFNTPTKSLSKSIKKCSFMHAVIWKDHATNSFRLAPRAQSTDILEVFAFDLLHKVFFLHEPTFYLFLARNDGRSIENGLQNLVHKMLSLNNFLINWGEYFLKSETMTARID